MEKWAFLVVYVPGIVAILVWVIMKLKRIGLRKVKASILTRDQVPLQHSSNGKVLYVATYAYELDGQRYEKRNDKLRTRATESEYIYLDKNGEIVDNSNNRNAGLLGFGIAWIVAVFCVLKFNLLGFN